ncbi:MAG: FAM221A/B family protein [Thermoguttaceae bacterium]|jgi:hypothetical protein
MKKYRYPYPFLLESKNVVVVDSLCQCVHRHTEHDRTFTQLENGKAVQGKCRVEGCPCLHFYWAKWLTGKDIPPSVKDKDTEGGAGALGVG